MTSTRDKTEPKIHTAFVRYRRSFPECGGSVTQSTFHSLWDTPFYMSKHVRHDNDAQPVIVINPISPVSSDVPVIGATDLTRRARSIL